MRARGLTPILLSIAVITRVAAAIVMGSEFHFADETHYVDAARSILSGDGFGQNYNRVPVFPVLLAGLLAVLPEPLVALRIAHAAVAGIIALVTLRLGERLFGYPAAAVAAVLVALDPLMVISSALFYPEAITAVAVVALVALCLKATARDSLTTTATAGFLIGLMVQLRQVALFFLPVVVVWLFLRIPAPKLRRATTHAAALGAACLLALAPWSLRNLAVQGSVSPVAMGGARHTIAESRSGEPRNPLSAIIESLVHDTKAQISHTSKRFVQFWELYPTRLATDYPKERAKMHEQDTRLPENASFPRRLRNTVSAVSFGSELLLALIGVGFALRIRRAETLLLLATILSFAFGYALLVSKMRYRIPILPLVFLFSGVGATEVFAAVSARLRRRSSDTT